MMTMYYSGSAALKGVWLNQCREQNLQLTSFLVHNLVCPERTTSLPAIAYG